MFVGDSLSLNQFESLGCMLHSWVPNTNTTYFRGGVLRSLTFEVLYPYFLYPFGSIYYSIYYLLHKKIVFKYFFLLLYVIYLKNSIKISFSLIMYETIC